MGTNYYLQIKNTIFDECPLVIQERKNEIIENLKLHIGKSSWGWRFLFQEQEFNGKLINSYEYWKTLLTNPNYEIVDEYNQVIDFKELDKLILSRQNEQKHTYLDSHYLSFDGFDFDRTEFS